MFRESHSSLLMSYKYTLHKLPLVHMHVHNSYVTQKIWSRILVIKWTMKLSTTEAKKQHSRGRSRVGLRCQMKYKSLTFTTSVNRIPVDENTF